MRRNFIWRFQRPINVNEKTAISLQVVLGDFLGTRAIAVRLRQHVNIVDVWLTTLLKDGPDTEDRMSQHMETCPLAPRAYRCCRPGCGFSYSTVRGLTGHVKKDHVEGAEIDAFAAALGLQQGSRVTPQMIIDALADSLFRGPGEGARSSEELPNNNERRPRRRKRE